MVQAEAYAAADSAAGGKVVVEFALVGKVREIARILSVHVTERKQELLG